MQRDQRVSEPSTLVQEAAFDAVMAQIEALSLPHSTENSKITLGSMLEGDQLAFQQHRAKHEGAARLSRRTQLRIRDYLVGMHAAMDLRNILLLQRTRALPDYPFPCDAASSYNGVRWLKCGHADDGVPGCALCKRVAKARSRVTLTSMTQGDGIDAEAMLMDSEYPNLTSHAHDRRRSTLERAAVPYDVVVFNAQESQL